MRPVLTSYANILLKKGIEDVNSYFREFIDGNDGKALENIIKNMTPAEAIEAGKELEKAWSAAEEQHLEQSQFNRTFLTELWSVMLNVAMAAIV